MRVFELSFVHVVGLRGDGVGVEQFAVTGFIFGGEIHGGFSANELSLCGGQCGVKISLGFLRLQNQLLKLGGLRGDCGLCLTLLRFLQIFVDSRQNFCPSSPRAKLSSSAS